MRNRRYLLWETSATAASAGYSVYAISVPWVAFTSTHNLFVVGLALFAELGVYTLTFLVGPWVDRARNKRTIYLLCYPAQAGGALFLGAALEGHFLSVPLLLGLIVFLSLLWDFAWAANNVAPRLLVERDDLFRAAGLGGAVGGATVLAGYAGGGALLVLVGPAGGFYVYAGLLACAAALAALVSLPGAVVDSPAGYLADFREGWRYFAPGAGNPLRRLAGVELVRGFFATAPTLLIVLIVTAAFSDAQTAFATFYVAWVSGGVAVGLLLGRLNPRGRIGRILVSSNAAAGILLGVAGILLPALVPSAVVWFAVGCATTSSASVEATYLQGAWPPAALGRISSNLYLFTGTAGSAGALLLGFLAQSLPPSQLGVLAALGFLAVAALFGSIPSLRRLGF